MLPANYIQSSIPVDIAEASDNQPLGFNIEIELDALEELIVNSTHVPLTEFIVIDRVVVLHQLNQIKEHLPVDLAAAIAIASRKQQIISEAENYAAALVKSAQEKASQILHDSSILRQAELDGAKMRLKTEQECEHLKQTTLNEVRELHQNAIAESQTIQQGADDYADYVLEDIEQKMQQILLIIQNGRQQLDGVN
ncbi:MAG: DivIVA domain-containing protein [Pleurocapsa sp. SU_5_0]|nr:DivIVA domain-containing protein [Pleurocapsa sp. SU_5_0]NJO97369.1 DivIVA domain-containing protein [Pleurocapsa sp. CRU_1_2]NJR47285.1 DivIVA domain-containing protein [Hyellaceae cyanobacterium CSU_1_1]